MSFTDPIAIAAASPTPALTMSRVSTGNFKSTYFDLANGYTFNVEHSDPTNHGKKQERHYARLQETKSVTLPSGSVVLQAASVSISMSVPPYGWTTAQKVALFLALFGSILDSDVSVAKLIGYET
jgi:hypothetical protein